MRRHKNKSAPLEVREFTHIRLCHVCLHLSESDNPIVNCQECSRYLTIEPLIEEHLGGNQKDDSDEEREGHGDITGGLQGLSVFW